MFDLQILKSHPPLMLAPEQKRRRLLGAMAEWAFSLARMLPSIIVLEDLH